MKMIILAPNHSNYTKKVSDMKLICRASSSQKKFVSRPTISCLNWCSNIRTFDFRSKIFNRKTRKIVDNFRIEKCSATDHTYLSFTQLLGHLERKRNQFWNLGSASDTMNKKSINNNDFWFSICTT